MNQDVKPIIIVQLICQLGNNMFQYAFFTYLRKTLGESYQYYLSDEGDSPDIVNVFPQIGEFLLSKEQEAELIIGKEIRYLHESSIFYSLYSPDILPEDNIVFTYAGSWQSYQYAESNKEKLHQDFSFDLNQLNRQSIDCLNKIKDSLSVGIHIRGGDYENEFYAISILGGICSEDYYLEALQRIKKELKGEDPTFFIFSNDIGWARQILKITDSESVFVDWNHDQDSWQDMCLMSNCKHNIIPNSTFGWWGAWLNPSPNKIIIAPSVWANVWRMANITPQEWIKIPIKPFQSSMDYTGLSVLIPIDISYDKNGECLKYMEIYFSQFNNISVLLICEKKTSKLSEIFDDKSFRILETKMSYSYTKYINYTIDNHANTKFIAVWSIFSIVSPIFFEETWSYVNKQANTVVFIGEHIAYKANSTQLEKYGDSKDIRHLLTGNEINKRIRWNKHLFMIDKFNYLRIEKENSHILSMEYATRERNKRLERLEVEQIAIDGEVYLIGDISFLNEQHLKNDLKAFLTTCKRF